MDIKRAYLNPKFPGSFSGLSGFLKSGKKRKASEAKEVLLGIPAYTLHFPKRKTFPRRFVYSPHINAQWGLDLLDVGRFSKSNAGTKFLVTAIDIFSKKAYIEAIKDKSGLSVKKALIKIFKRSNGIPQMIQSDQGKEIFNQDVGELFRLHKIKLFSVQSELKCSVVERFNRTIMEKIRRYMTNKGTEKFVDKLQFFENLYNSSYHRSIKSRPKDVSIHNQAEVHDRLYANRLQLVDQRKEKFKIGDKVLISKVKKIFDKGSAPNYQKETFFVHSIRNTCPRTYILKDENNEIIEGGFYREELLKIG